MLTNASKHVSRECRHNTKAAIRLHLIERRPIPVSLVPRCEVDEETVPNPMVSQNFCIRIMPILHDACEVARKRYFPPPAVDLRGEPPTEEADFLFISVRKGIFHHGEIGFEERIIICIIIVRLDSLQVPAVRECDLYIVATS